jgi:hypothetical protein
VPDVETAAPVLWPRREAGKSACGLARLTLHQFGDPFGHGFCFIQFERNETYDD